MANVWLDVESSSDEIYELNLSFYSSEDDPNKFYSENNYISSNGYMYLSTYDLLNNTKIHLYNKSGYLLLENINSGETIEIKSKQIEIVGVPSEDTAYRDIGINSSCLYMMGGINSIWQLHDLQFNYI